MPATLLDFAPATSGLLRTYADRIALIGTCLMNISVSALAENQTPVHLGDLVTATWAAEFGG
jgi:hypothetical protein